MLASMALASVAGVVGPRSRPASDSLASPIQLGAFSVTEAFDSSTFHLGNAAGAFGWSSAIADFDDDGRPDFTVADRQAGSAGSYSYRILFGVAGRAVQSVSFQSFSSALNVAVRDVDHDNDLDVLITEAPSAVVNSVWLNDGHGQFVRSTTTAASSAWMADAAFDSSTECPSPPVVVSDRFAARRETRSNIGPVEPAAVIFDSRVRVHTTFLTAAAPCRAPPSLDSLSA